MHIKSPSKLVRCTQITQRKKRNAVGEDTVRVLQKMPVPHYFLMAVWKEEGTERTSGSQFRGTGEWTKLMALPSSSNHESNPLHLPTEISQGKLLEVAVHGQKKLARGNFSRPQERGTMQELPQRAKKQLGARRWLRTGSTSSKINNLVNKEMVRSNFPPLNCSLFVWFVSQTINLDNSAYL